MCRGLCWFGGWLLVCHTFVEQETVDRVVGAEVRQAQLVVSVCRRDRDEVDLRVELLRRAVRCHCRPDVLRGGGWGWGDASVSISSSPFFAASASPACSSVAPGMVSAAASAAAFAAASFARFVAAFASCCLAN